MSDSPLVLVVSHWMTPAGEVGAKRFAYFGRELEALGYQVRVVSAELSASSRLDDTLPTPRHVSRVAAMFRVPTGDVAGWRRMAAALARRTCNAVMDNDIGWVPRAVAEAKRVTRGHSRGVVIVSMPPYSSALAGVRIAQSTGWPLILDYRDPWTGYPWPDRFDGPLARRVAHQLESWAVRASAARVLNTPEMRDYFVQRFPWAEPDRNWVIRNGVEDSPKGQPSERFSYDILYAGEIYNDRSLIPILKGLRSLAASDTRFEGFMLTIFGHLNEGKRAEIASAGLESFVEVHDPVPRADLLPRLRQAKALLAVSGAQMMYSVPYKIYEYIGAGKPVLGLSPSGSALESLIHEYRIGAHADPEDDEGNDAAVRDVLCNDYANALALAADDLSWRRLAARYASLIDQCVLNPQQPALSDVQG